MPARNTLIIGVLMFFVVVLSATYFLQASLRLDEAQSLWQTSRSPGEILTMVGKDVHVPLYHLLLHGWRLLGPDTVAWARMLSLLCYLLSIPALYMLGKLAYGRSAGLFAAALFAVSPFLNWYGNEIRMYALFVLLVILNQYFYLRLMRPHSDHTWAGYILTSAAGVFVHYFFFLILLGQAAYYLMRKELFPIVARRRLYGSWAAVLGIFAPWALFVLLLGEAANQQPLLTPPTSVNVFSTFAQFLFGFQDDHINTFFLSLWPITLILGIFALRKTRALQPETEYFMLTIVLAVSLAFVASLTVRPVFVSRYLILAVPALYLLIASLFALYPLRAAHYARGGLIALMLVMLATEIINPATPVKEQYREAATYLAQNAAAQDVIVLSAPFTVYPIEYYYRGPASVVTLPAWDRYAFGPIPAYAPERMPEEVAALTEDHQYAWVLLSYDQGYKEDVRLYFDTHYERVLAKNFSPGLDLYVYKLRYDTPLSEESVVWRTEER